MTRREFAEKALLEYARQIVQGLSNEDLAYAVSAKIQCSSCPIKETCKRTLDKTVTCTAEWRTYLNDACGN